jgi:putative transposase
VTAGKGVKINHLQYWSTVFRDPAVEGTCVPIRYDPYDAGTAFAYVGNRWVTCHSEHFSLFHGRSEREMMIAAAELHKRYRDHSRQFKLTARRLADFVASTESEESLLVQRLQDAAARRIHLESGQKDDRCEHDATLQGESASSSEPELALREPSMAKRKPVPPPELYEEY